MSGGDIWSTGAFTFESPLKDLLDSQNYSLEDLLSEDELLQELRGLHPILVSYFSSEENVADLIRCLVNPPLTFQEFLFMKAKQDKEQKLSDSDKKIYLSSGDNFNQSSWLLDKTSEAKEKEGSDTELNPREEYENFSIRFPYMACEIICCEVPSILDIIIYGYASSEKNTETSDSEDRETLLDLLFSMLFNTPEYQLDDRRSGYLEKIITVLFRTRQDVMTSYINGDHLHEITVSEGIGPSCNVPKHRGGGEALLRALFKQLHSNSISQIIQYMFMPKQHHLSHAEGHQEGEIYEPNESDQMGCGLDNFCGISCNWSDSEVGLQLLLERLFVDISSLSEVLLNASQHSCEILNLIVQHSQLDSNIIKTLTSEPTLSRLIQSACGSSDYSLSTPRTFHSHESSMTTAMNVLEILILQLGGYGTVVTGHHDDVNGTNGADASFDYNTEKLNVVDTLKNQQVEELKVSVSQCLISRLPSFLECLSKLLTHPDASNWTSHCQFSEFQQPLLGSSRLRIVRLIESMVLLSIREVDLILCESECLEICLNLFWYFPWCSMLHQSVANLLVHVLEGGEDRIDLQKYFLNRCNLPQRLMDSFKNDTFFTSYTNIDGNHQIKLISNGLPEAGRVPVLDDDTKKCFECTGQHKNVSFRMGYMGHVIIICQALVHACEYEDSPEQSTEVCHNDIHNSDSVNVHAKLNPESDNASVTLTLLQKNKCYLEWQTFISTTLAAETSLQSTPLGACNVTQSNEPLEIKTEYSWNLSEKIHEMANEGFRHKFILSSEEIDLDDTDLDIAASMMESMNLPASEEADKTLGHRRQRGIISGQDFSKGTEFGTVVHIYKGSADYDFEDPLGSSVQFEMDEHQQEDEDHENDVDDDGAPPVMDLFAGNFDSLDNGWANFDDAFAEAEDLTSLNSSNYNQFEEASNSSDSDEG